MRTLTQIKSAYARPFGNFFIPYLGNAAVIDEYRAKRLLGLLLQAKKHQLPYCSKRRRMYR